MIALFSQNQVSNISSHSNEYLDSRVTAIASNVDNVSKYGNEAVSLGAEIISIGATTVDQVLETAKRVFQLKKLLTRKKFSTYIVDVLEWSSALVRHYLAINDAFGSFATGALSRLEPQSLSKLLSKRYAPLIEKMHSEQGLTPIRVEALKKELFPRLPKTQVQKQGGWKKDPSGGGRRYETIVYDEKTGTKIEQLAQERSVTPQAVIKEAIAAFGTSTTNLTEEQIRQSERQAVVSQVREAHIEFQRQINDKDNQIEQQRIRIAELESKLAEEQKNKMQQSLFNESQFLRHERTISQPAPTQAKKSDHVSVADDIATTPQSQESVELQLDHANSSFSVGDRIKMMTPWPNGDMRDVGKPGTVKRLTKDGKVCVHLDNTRNSISVMPEAIALLSLDDATAILLSSNDNDDFDLVATNLPVISRSEYLEDPESDLTDDDW